MIAVPPQKHQMCHAPSVFRMHATKIASRDILAATTLVGCGGGGDAAGCTGETAEGGSAAAAGSGEIKEFDAFFAVPGSEIIYDNEIQQLIAE